MSSIITCNSLRPFMLMLSSAACKMASFRISSCCWLLTLPYIAMSLLLVSTITWLQTYSRTATLIRMLQRSNQFRRVIIVGLRGGIYWGRRGWSLDGGLPISKILKVDVLFKKHTLKARVLAIALVVLLVFVKSEWDNSGAAVDVAKNLYVVSFSWQSDASSSVEKGRVVSFF